MKINKEKTAETINSAKENLIKGSAILKAKTAEAAKKLGEELNEINSAKNKAIEETLSTPSESKIENTKTLGRSFWTKITKIQKNLIAATTLILIACTLYFSKNVATALLILSIATIIGLVLMKIISINEIIQFTKTRPVLSLFAALLTLSIFISEEKPKKFLIQGQDGEAFLQNGLKNFQKMHDSICNTPLQVQVQKCTEKNGHSHETTRWCVDTFLEAKKQEGCL